MSLFHSLFPQRMFTYRRWKNLTLWTCQVHHDLPVPWLLCLDQRVNFENSILCLSSPAVFLSASSFIPGKEWHVTCQMLPDKKAPHSAPPTPHLCSPMDTRICCLPHCVLWLLRCRLFFLLFYWSIVDLHCWINFSCTAKWFSYTHMYIIFYILVHYDLS